MNDIPIGEVVKALNDCYGVAYAEGYIVGRDSRQAVVEAAKDVVCADTAGRSSLAVEDLAKALADDEEGK